MTISAFARDARDAIRYGLDLDFEKFMVAQGDALNLCGDFDEDGHPTDAGIAAAERFIARARNWTPVAWAIYGAWQAAGVIATALHCEIAGHDIEDDSYGGPDSGCIAGHCCRCGWSFHDQLY